MRCNPVPCVVLLFFKYREQILYYHMSKHRRFLLAEDYYGMWLDLDLNKRESLRDTSKDTEGGTLLELT